MTLAILGLGTPMLALMGVATRSRKPMYLIAFLWVSVILFYGVLALITRLTI